MTNPEDKSNVVEGFLAEGSEPVSFSNYTPSGVNMYFYDKYWKPPIAPLRWKQRVWCHRKDRWMSYSLRGKDWTSYIGVEWKELDLDFDHKGNPIPISGWEVPDDWDKAEIRYLSNFGHSIHGKYIQTVF